MSSSQGSMSSVHSLEDLNKKRGRFFKKGATNTGFRERYFVLDKQAGVLHYHEDERAYAAGTGEKGHVLLGGCHVRSVHDKERLEQYDHKHHKGPTGRSAKFQHGDAQAAHNQGLDMYQWVVDDVQSKRLWEFASKTEQARRDWMAAVKKCAGPVQCFQVQILEVDHLPKTDKMGKCDPQVKVTMGPHSHTTVHQDKTYKASYSQTFDYPAIHLNDLVVEVQDYNVNPLNPVEFIGSHTVPAAALQGLMGKGSGAKQTFSNITVKDRKGNIVRGFDGQETLVTFQVSYECK